MNWGEMFGVFVTSFAGFGPCAASRAWLCRQTDSAA